MVDGTSWADLGPFTDHTEIMLYWSHAFGWKGRAGDVACIHWQMSCYILIYALVSMSQWTRGDLNILWIWNFYYWPPVAKDTMNWQKGKSWRSWNSDMASPLIDYRIVTLSVQLCVTSALPELSQRDRPVQWIYPWPWLQDRTMLIPRANLFGVWSVTHSYVAPKLVTFSFFNLGPWGCWKDRSQLTTA